MLQPKQEVIQNAKKNQDGLVFWTDGSRSDKGKIGAAVVWFDKKLDKWPEKRRFLEENKDPYNAELWAIADALVLGIRKIGNADCTTVTIFTDSQAAITKISDQRTRVGGDAIRNLIHQNALTIKNAEHTTVLQWVPGHSKLLGNERADMAAKDCAHNGGRQTNHWSSLTYIKSELQKARSAELLAWHQTKSQEREATARGYYVPSTKSCINPTLGGTPKKYAMRFYQLKIGHEAVGIFLAKIGVIKTPECWWCRTQEQTVIHLYTQCRRWKRELKKLSRELGQLGIGWQPRPEKRGLDSLLANEKAVEPILQFLRNTELGSRDGTRERELKWQRRSDEEGENQLAG